MQTFEDLDTAYFHIDIDLAELDTQHWRARARIVRKDTGEVAAGGTEVTEHSREQALQSLYKFVRDKIAAMPAPADWQANGAATYLVRRYIDYNNRMSDLYMDLESCRKDNVLSQQALQEKFQTLKQEITTTDIALCKAVNRCGQDEQLQLVTSPEECYSDVGNPWYLDDLYARDALYQYILEPSVRVTEAHEQHHNRMTAQLKVSGSFAGSLH
jgi:hypothetical protein